MDILARYVGADPSDLEFLTTARGKPTLTAPRGTNLRFNVADARGLALVVVALGRELGVDVEALRTIRYWERLATRYFDPEVAASILALPAVEQPHAFLRSWVRHEATVKALGTGLHGSAFCTAAPGAATRQPSFPITVHDLELPSGWVGALAIEGRAVRIVQCNTGELEATRC